VTGRGGEQGKERAAASGLHGILVVDKPVGPTSHDVVALARRLSGTRKIGHGGTLDPFASGVLPLYLGVATRIAEFHLGARKAYRATVVFGSVSTTDDLEGELSDVEGAPPTRDVVAAALAGFLGTVQQRPPAFSARKVGGRRAYALARRGEEPALRPREVTFAALDLVAWDDADGRHPVAIVDVTCSAGTYVRALARDLGVATGGGAYLAALRRTAAGPFGIDDASSLDEVRAAAAAGRLGELLRPPGAGLDDLPSVTLAAAELRAVAHGGWTGPIHRLGHAAATAGEGSAVRLVTAGGQLAAIARVTGAGYLVPDKVLVDRDAAGA
jgi:tRNA pseudouridine55 synthase